MAVTPGPFCEMLLPGYRGVRATWGAAILLTARVCFAPPLAPMPEARR